MCCWTFPIGTAFVSGFGIRQPRKSRGIEIDIDVDSIAETVRDLQAVPLKVRARVIKKALREWGRIVIKSAKRNVSWRSKVLKRNIIQKVATYPKGASNARVKRIWLGIGVRRIPGSIRVDVGKRAHLYEAGWSPWPKGVTPRRVAVDRVKRRGNYRGQPPERMRAILAFARRMNRWRSRLKGTKANRVYVTRYLGNAGATHVARLSQLMAESANAAILEVSNGKN
jgi:hypothetical protein